jgi:hypothetical protein
MFTASDHSQHTSDKHLIAPGSHFGSVRDRFILSGLCMKLRHRRRSSRVLWPNPGLGCTPLFCCAVPSFDSLDGVCERLL